jgi:hypothetical protein
MYGKHHRFQADALANFGHEVRLQRHHCASQQAGLGAWVEPRREAGTA